MIDHFQPAFYRPPIPPQVSPDDKILFHRQMFKDTTAFNNLNDPGFGDFLGVFFVDPFSHEDNTSIRHLSVFMFEQTGDGSRWWFSPPR